MAVAVGEKAPDFTLVNSDGHEAVSLSDYAGKNVVLAFFPAAFSGVCQTELCTFRASLSQFESLDADALVYPSVACVQPAIDETEDEDNTRRINLRCLRNTARVNYFDGCAISLPCHEQGTAPVGLMLSSKNGTDERLYQIAAAVEAEIER